MVDAGAAKHRRHAACDFSVRRIAERSAKAFAIEWLGTFDDGRSRKKACTLCGQANGGIDAANPVVDRRSADGAFWAVHF